MWNKFQLAIIMPQINLTGHCTITMQSSQQVKILLLLIFKRLQNYYYIPT